MEVYRLIGHEVVLRLTRRHQASRTVSVGSLPAPWSADTQHDLHDRETSLESCKTRNIRHDGSELWWGSDCFESSQSIVTRFMKTLHTRVETSSSLSSKLKVWSIQAKFSPRSYLRSRRLNASTPISFSIASKFPFFFAIEQDKDRWLVIWDDSSRLY